MNEYISFNDLMKLTIDKNEEKQLNESETYNDTSKEIYDIPKIFQISGIRNKNKAIIKHIGYAKTKSQIILKEFMFKNYNCKIVSHVYTEIEIKEMDNLFKMVSLSMYKQNELMAVLSLEFNITEFNGKTLLELLSCDDKNIDIEGLFTIYLYKNNDNNKIKLYTFDKFPGNNNIIEKLIKFLINDELMYLY